MQRLKIIQNSRNLKDKYHAKSMQGILECATTELDDKTKIKQIMVQESQSLALLMDTSKKQIKRIENKNFDIENKC